MLEAIQSTVVQLASGIAWGKWLSAAVLLLLGLLIGSLVSRNVGRLVEKRTTKHHQAIIRRVFFYLVFIIFGMAALREAGFSLEVVLGAAGILTVAIGFASQTSASNIISGLFLVMEKPFEIGDMIEVDATAGEVIAIDLLSVKIRTPDNLFVRVPNETLIKTRVINRSRFPIRRIDLVLGIAYAEDVEKVRDLLLELAQQNTVCLEEPKPFVLVTGFGASSVDLQFSFWVPRGEFLDGRGSMMIAVKKALDEHGIEIPFPHTSVYAGSHSEPFRVQLMAPEQQKDKDSPDVDRND
ncbi:MAG: mechanosensitive ion channel family protein [Marinobacter sp.]|uniref:mechanosensitive ion channel family protein n=1 Tax=Marinobacter sp. TaxID=50741 RepID=UPI0029C3D9C0|nr:mechanosensitive ion channel family protein [Marinobacter sp.]MDX5441657.1 mechanosensitive ion channel family protein [Alteromonadaceae bacterium]MDX5328378.1 mechanosensitive ion channel family protein [Marinobacter sp.]MDX5334679.1 mechanosensitive ion channel family protein [Marinobacter sp.]MDX5385222.1 mechanosensitive ion channel family protein [Marinobacter sp.]MDX5470925.1 mechanosensitive ion channel family protein [Marinobacter sp.]